MSHSWLTFSVTGRQGHGREHTITWGALVHAERSPRSTECKQLKSSLHRPIHVNKRCLHTLCVWKGERLSPGKVTRWNVARQGENWGERKGTILLIFKQFFKIFILFIWLDQVLVAACRIQFPDRGSNPDPLYSECRVLVTGPLGKSWEISNDFLK